VTAKDLQQDLVATGIGARTPRRTPILTQKHKSAQNHINKPQQFWVSVLWSDETKTGTFWPCGSAVCLEEEE